MFDELAERSLMSPLAGTKHTYVRLAIIIYCEMAEISNKEVNFLDTTAYVYKGERFCNQRILDVRTHFKPSQKRTQKR